MVVLYNKVMPLLDTGTCSTWTPNNCIKRKCTKYWLILLIGGVQHNINFSSILSYFSFCAYYTHFGKLATSCYNYFWLSTSPHLFQFSCTFWNRFCVWFVFNCLWSVWEAIFLGFSWIEVVAWNVSLHHKAPHPVLEQLLLAFWSPSLGSGTPLHSGTPDIQKGAPEWKKKIIFLLDLLWMFVMCSQFPPNPLTTTLTNPWWLY